MIRKFKENSPTFVLNLIKKKNYVFHANLILVILFFFWW